MRCVQVKAAMTPLFASTAGEFTYCCNERKEDVDVLLTALECSTRHCLLLVVCPNVQVCLNPVLTHTMYKPGAGMDRTFLRALLLCNRMKHIHLQIKNTSLCNTGI